MNLRLVALAIAGVVFVLDRVTKIRIEQSVSPFETHEVIPGFFNIIHTQNRGAAFSLFANLDDTWRTVFLVGFSLGALAVVISLLWSATKPQQPPALALIWGLGLILGGAVGNLYDRIAKGSVTDFLDFYYGPYHWATFNIADSAITVGAALLIIDMLWLERKRSAARLDS